MSHCPLFFTFNGPAFSLTSALPPRFTFLQFSLFSNLIHFTGTLTFNQGLALLILVPWPKPKRGDFSVFCLPTPLKQTVLSFPYALKCQILRLDKPAGLSATQVISWDHCWLNTCSFWALCRSRRDNAFSPLPAALQ